ncbi:MAG: PrsW family intramembrane metalloprotease [Bacilli bacterium]|nr:PrsW family intramembrane metalloprotease [Bacilli bacterium]
MKFLLYLAILPSVIIGYLIYRLDKVEKEPVIELIKALFLGVGSAVLAIFLSYLFGIIKIEVSNVTTFPGLFCYAIIGVALVEEGCKWLCTFLLLRKNKNYNYLFDGIVYAVFVSLGFATIENIIYSLMGGLESIIIRDVLTVPAHAFFGVFMGYYLSFAKSSKLQKKEKEAHTFLFLSIMIPILLHGFFDFLLLSQESFFLFIFFLFIICLYTISIRQIRLLMKMERPFLKKEYCNQCGSKVSGAFCSICGKKLENEEEETSI